MSVDHEHGSPWAFHSQSSSASTPSQLSPLENKVSIDLSVSDCNDNSNQVVDFTDPDSIIDSLETYDDSVDPQPISEEVRQFIDR